jgi:MerR family copper efflux transcriptional regulator
MTAMLGLNVDMKSRAVPIGEAAARHGLATHVLRHWEAMGLLAPGRVVGDRRRYDDEDLYRIALIVRAKQAGLSLDDIRAIIVDGDPDHRHEVIDRRRAELVRRIEQAQSALALLNCAADCRHEDLTACPNLRAHLEAGPG